MLEIDVRAKIANQMMYIKVLHVYLKADTNPKRTIYDQTAASSKHMQQARRRRLQRRQTNSSSNRGVGSIGTIDTPPLYSVWLSKTNIVLFLSNYYCSFDPLLAYFLKKLSNILIAGGNVRLLVLWSWMYSILWKLRGQMAALRDKQIRHA